MRRRIAVLGGLVALAAGLLFLATAAFGASGSFTDVTDDCEPACGLDLTTVAHADSSGNITYTLTTANGYDAADIGTLDVIYNYNGDSTPDDFCIRVADDGAGALTAYAGTSCTTNTSAQDGDISVFKTDGSSSIQIVVPVASLDGFDPSTDNTYEYFVDLLDVDDNLDTAPNPDETASGDADNNGYYTHVLGSTVTPPPSTSATQSLAAVNDTTPCPNQVVNVRGTGFASGQILDVAIDATRIGGAQSDFTGSYNTNATIPSSVTAGLHRIRVTGASASGGTHTSFADITVGACTLPVTGTGPIGPVAAAIAGLAAVSGAGLAIVRRRRTA